MVYCCVVNCHNNTVAHKGIVGFYRFPEKNIEKRKLWIRAVKRANPDGSNWMPSKHSRICSDHFINGETHPTRTHPSYKPTIFPSRHTKNPGVPAVLRFQRLEKRKKLSKLKQQTPQPGN